MTRTVSRTRHKQEGLWFFILIAIIMALAFVGVGLFAPR